MAKSSGDYIPLGGFVFEDDLPLMSSLPSDERGTKDFTVSRAGF
jgi:hypothetical protein